MSEISLKYATKTHETQSLSLNLGVMKFQRDGGGAGVDMCSRFMFSTRWAEGSIPGDTEADFSENSK